MRMTVASLPDGIFVVSLGKEPVFLNPDEAQLLINLVSIQLESYRRESGARP